ncbi:MAG: hypothetical protein U0487_00700 [Patescibacteria group bacterium]
MVDIKRKKNETFDAMLRRFQRRFQSSGKQIETKKRRFHDSGPNRNGRRFGALRREFMSQQYDYLMKTGQLKEEKRKPGRR